MAGLKNVLVVEDDGMIRDLYRSTLVNNDFTVEAVSSADELYEKLHTFHPDCILLDIMLPGVSGLEILQELRKNPVHGCQDTKIVILTNLAQRSVADSAIENGADGFIIKADILPRDLPKIIATLEE